MVCKEVERLEGKEGEEGEIGRKVDLPSVPCAPVPSCTHASMHPCTMYILEAREAPVEAVERIGRALAYEAWRRDRVDDLHTCICAYACTQVYASTYVCLFVLWKKSRRGARLSQSHVQYMCMHPCACACACMCCQRRRVAESITHMHMYACIGWVRVFV